MNDRIRRTALRAAPASWTGTSRQNAARGHAHACGGRNASRGARLRPYSTVTDFARLRGLSTSVPRAQAV